MPTVFEVDSLKSAKVKDNFIVVIMRSGLEVRFPIAGNPRLACGTSAQINNIEISPFGLHWPDLDEDLSFSGLLAGNYGQAGACRVSCCIYENRAALLEKSY